MRPTIAASSALLLSAACVAASLPGPPDAPARLPSTGFTPVEQGGLFFSLSNLTYSLNISANQSSPRGYTTNQSMSLTAAIVEPLGQTPFRVSDIRLEAFETASGRDISHTGEFAVWPNPGSGRAFTRPYPNSSQGSPINAQVQISLSNTGVRDSLARIAGEVEVQVVRSVERFSLPKQASQEYTELLPGLRFRMTQFREQVGGQVTLSFDYRIEPVPHKPGFHEAPFFYSFALYDEKGQALMQTTEAREMVAQNAVVGSYAFQTGIGNREIAEIVLEVVSSVETVVFGFEQSGLDQLD
ncbi:MAG: hypothetical protein H6811_02030 [Phycisphaeraceae bacterium]|nr:hypothetical protein [Phycisphaeraceae bacterium]